MSFAKKGGKKVNEIDIRNLTRDYGNGKGVFDICLTVGRGEAYGYLKLIAAMRKMKDFSAAEKLIDYFELDPKGKIRSMSKGMKQKTALVAAFMHDPEILLLDEPSSGLDPLMQGKLIELIENEKKRGKTILLSSHIFEEVEKTCDRIGMIKSGRIIRQITAGELGASQMKTYRVIMADDEGCINELLSLLSAHRVLSLTEEKHTLEEYFMKFYGGDEK